MDRNENLLIQSLQKCLILKGNASTFKHEEVYVQHDYLSRVKVVAIVAADYFKQLENEKGERLARKVIKMQLRFENGLKMHPF